MPDRLPLSSPEQKILSIIKNSRRRLSVASLIFSVRKTYPQLTPDEIKSFIRSLVDSGELSYSYHFGQSCLEPNFNRPIPLTRRFVLAPDSFSNWSRPGKIIIRLARGAAFGLGDHSSTRLALAGLEFISEKMAEGLVSESPGWALDIGTGTGILALAAVKAGLVDFVNAFDIDSCARFEARRNIALNRLSNQIFVDSCWPGHKDAYQLVLANLRLPTINRYAGRIAASVKPGAFLVASGIRPEETSTLEMILRKKGFKRFWQSSSLGWCGCVFRMPVV